MDWFKQNNSYVVPNRIICSLFFWGVHSVIWFDFVCFPQIDNRSLRDERTSNSWDMSLLRNQCGTSLRAGYTAYDLAVVNHLTCLNRERTTTYVNWTVRKTNTTKLILSSHTIKTLRIIQCCTTKGEAIWRPLLFFKYRAVFLELLENKSHSNK